MTSNLGQQVRLRRLSELIAEELRRMILYGRLNQLEKLPPEPEFAAELGVSRHHLREALRLLERDGLVQVRPGRNGGIYLTVPGVAELTRTFAAILAHDGTSLRDLMAARLIIEPAAAAMAARDITEEELTELEKILRRQETADGYVSGINTEFHVGVASAAHNQTVLLMMRSIESIIRNLDVQAGLPAQAPDPALRPDSVRAHRAILRALRDHASERAADLVRRHLIGYEQRLQDRGIDSVTRSVASVLQAADGTGVISSNSDRGWTADKGLISSRG